MSDLISVILPVYNVEEYLDRCMDSILKQDYSNLEVILVDDGATDKSGEKCDLYAYNDERVKVIHKDNGGVSSARNRGLEEARGEYILFVDPDDYLEEGIVNILYDNMQHKSVDLVECSYTKFDDNGRIAPYQKNKVGKVSSEEALIHFLKWDGEVTPYCWDKLYNRAIIGDLRFDQTLKVGEDALFVFQYICRCKSIGMIAQTGYWYYLRGNSAIGNKYSHKRMEAVHSAKRVYELGREQLVLRQYFELYFSLAVFFAFSSLLNTVSLKELKDYQEDYMFYMGCMKQSSLSSVWKFCTTSLRCLWILCRYSPMLYKFSARFRKGAR